MKKNEQAATISRPLKPEEHLGFMLYRVGRKVANAYAEATRPLGYSPVEIGLLTHLAACGSDHVRSIGRLLGVSPQTVLNAADRLMFKRLVRRKRSTDDDRMVRLSLTGAGKTRLQAIEQVVAVFDCSLTCELGEEESAKMILNLHRLLSCDLTIGSKPPAARSTR